jgi:hypothetical protein
MSSPKRRIETDVSRRYVYGRWHTGLTCTTGHEDVRTRNLAAKAETALTLSRLMSDYEVTLVNDNSRCRLVGVV